MHISTRIRFPRLVIIGLIATLTMSYESYGQISIICFLDGANDVEIEGCGTDALASTFGVPYSPNPTQLSSWAEVEASGFQGFCSILVNGQTIGQFALDQSNFLAGEYVDGLDSGTCPITGVRAMIVQVSGLTPTNPPLPFNSVVAGEVDYTIDDTTTPTVGTQPSNATFECDGSGNTTEVNNWINSQGGGVVTDNCNINLSEAASAVGGCSGGTATYTWTYADDCNNSVNTSASYSIVDTTDPMITTNASDMTVECDGVGNTTELNNWLSSNGGAAATDVCSAITWSNNFTSLSDLCGATGAATVTFTASDGCGNNDRTTATFTIIDSNAPAISTGASDMTVECDGSGNMTELNNWLNTQGGASVTESCSVVTWTNDFTSLSDLCGATGSATVTFTATDDCGNNTATTATFTISDNTGPSITCPGDFNVSTDPDATTAVVNFSVATADACGGTSLSYSDNNTPGSAFPIGTTAITVTSTDDCDNTSDCSFNITISDTQGPTALCQDITISLDNTGNITIDASQVDNGSFDPGEGTITLTVDPASFTCDNVGDNSVTLTATDNSNNPASCGAVVTILSDIPDPSAVGDVICTGTSATLTATTGGANGTFIWYSDLAGTAQVSTDNPYITDPLTGATTYTVREVSGGCMSGLVQVVATVTTIPSPSAMPVTICAGSTATLNAVSGGTNGSFSWFDSGDGTGNVLSTDASFETPELTSTTSYWLREEGPTCNSDLVEVVVTVDEQPEEPTISDVAVCSGETASFLATSGTSGGTYEWFADSGGAQLIFSGNPYTTGALTSDTDLWVRQTLGDCSSDLVQVTATVNALPANPTTNAPVTICSGETTTLMAMGAGGTYEWYADAIGSQLVATGETYDTGAITSATSFWVREVDNNGCISGLVEAEILIAPPLADPLTFSDMVCSGDSTILTVTTGGANGSFIWFADAGGVFQVGDGASFNTGPLTTNTSFWVQETDGSCFSDLVKVDVIVVSNPPKPNAVDDEICAGETGTLMAITGGGNGNFAWYADSLGTVLVSNTNPFITPVLTSDTTFYVQESVGMCVSELTAATVTVNALPTNPEADTVFICAGADAELSASNSGGTTEWYSDAGGNDLIGTGTPFTISNVNLSTSVWVRENDGNCTSDLVKVEIVVTAIPDIPIGEDATICEGDSITLAAINTIGIISWSDAIDFSNILTTGNSFDTGPLTSSTTYYIRESNNGCLSGIDSVTVTVSPLPTGLMPTTDSPICSGEDIILSAATIANGIYSWTGPNSFSSSLQTAEITGATSDNAGTYSVNVTVDGCTSPDETVEVVINENPALPDGEAISTDATNNSICEGETLTLISPEVSGVNYQWTYPDGTVSNSSDPNRTITNVNESVHQGFYTLQLIDNTTNCVSEVYSLLVMVFSVPTDIAASNDGPACEGDGIQLDASNFINATYSWTGPNGFTSDIRNPFISNVTTDNGGIYTVNITTGDGCLIAQDAVTVVDINPLPTPVASADDINPLQDVSVQLDATGGNSYTWNASSFLSSLGISNPVASGMPVGSTTFTVTTFNEFGCSAQDSVTVNVQPQTVLEIYDLFTPNNDGVNDTWVISYLENIGDYSLIVWDRGGYKILESTAYSNDWDGTYKGNPVPEGTYWYSIRTSDTEYKGAITIKR
ncbi:MAG: T9SS type B sorting domain-containing protein [Bacteroidota bacterium]